jgi:alkylated DNA repair dioxygenase AlkB
MTAMAAVARPREHGPVDDRSTSQPGSGDLRIARHTPVQRHQLDESSWVEVVAGFVVDAETEYAAFRAQTPWQQNEILRYDKYVPEKRLGAGLAADRSPLLRQTSMHLRSRYGVEFSGVGALLYRDGDDFQGLHSDREMRWLDDTLIAIVVLGVRRPFVFRERRPLSTDPVRGHAGELDGDLVLLPGEGDLLVMGGAVQRDWLHGVPAAGTDQARISLTWRWTSRRGRPDTNPAYSEGRQYSDVKTRPGSRQVRP